MQVTEFSNEWYDTYGLGYRVVPRNVFFQYFPEYELEIGGPRNMSYKWNPEFELDQSKS